MHVYTNTRIYIMIIAVSLPLPEKIFEVGSSVYEDDDVFYGMLEFCYDRLETAIGSECNMNQSIREDARNSLEELKYLIKKHFESIKSSNHREASGESFKNILVNIWLALLCHCCS